MPIIVFLECRPSKKCDQSARTNARFPNYYVFLIFLRVLVFSFLSEKWFSHIWGDAFFGRYGYTQFIYKTGGRN